MAGLTAANKLYNSSKNQLFELLVVEGGTRIGGRINSSEFCGDRIEEGATWIHGIEGSPVHKIAQELNLLHSNQPWECMDGFSQDPVTVAEGGYLLDSSLVQPISTLFDNLMGFVQRKEITENGVVNEILSDFGGENRSVGSFLRRGLEAYWGHLKDQKVLNGVGNWSRKSLEEGIFGMHESIQRTYTSAGDLFDLDYNSESEYVMFPGEEITIAKGYSSVIKSLASVLPVGSIQLGRKVAKIEWQSNIPEGFYKENGCDYRPVKLHFCDGSIVLADHVIVTVSLGVLKRGIREESCLFSPPLPRSKAQAISRLGFGVVNKVFLQLSPSLDQEIAKFPFLQMVFHPPDSNLKDSKIPQWMRRTSFVTPIYKNSRVLLSWFTGQEALELESLSDEEITEGFSKTISNLLPKPNSDTLCNGSETPEKEKQLFSRVFRSKWGSNPLFLGSYSYVAVGSSADDMDILAEPLPENYINVDSPPPLQILFAGEATHRTHYSTTHGAYFSGLREANRILKYYNCMDE